MSLGDIRDIGLYVSNSEIYGTFGYVFPTGRNTDMWETETVRAMCEIK